MLLLPAVLVAVLTLGAHRSAGAQSPIVVQNQDTTYFIYNPVLDLITVTANRHTSLNTLSNLIAGSELTTSISGITKDLQRDLPSMVRLYTPQGLPLLTKYTSNNSLTATIPDSAANLELQEPSAKYPNPDAPVILRPNYLQRGTLMLSPLTQGLSLSAGNPQQISGSLNISHAGVLHSLEQWVPELQAYNTTYAGLGAFRANIAGNQTEVVAYHSESRNNYGNLLNIERLYESDHSTNIFVNHTITLGRSELHLGVSHQHGKEFRQVRDLNTRYTVNNQVEATAYTIGFGNNTTELRAIYHDLYRIYPWSQDSVQMRHVETMITHRQQLSPKTALTIEARYDHHDHEPSVSGRLLWQAANNVILRLNTGRLYDAVASEGLNNLMYSVQTKPHPWTTAYATLGTDLYFGPTTISASVSRKNIHRGWYGHSANTQGWVTRLGANGHLKGGPHPYRFLWNIGGVFRSMSLEIKGLPSQGLPGPARLEGHSSLGLHLKKMRYQLQADAFIDRKMRIAEGINANLGSQYFLTMEAVRKMDTIELGVSISNALRLAGERNYIMAHYNESKGITYINAPVFLNITLGIKLY